MQTFFLPEKFLMNIYCKSGGAIYHQPASITYIVLGALLGTESLSFIFSFWRWCICMSQLPRLQIMFSYISGKFNFISDPITNFYLGLAAQWVIDNFLYFCWIVLKYLWSVILLNMVIWWHLEDPSVRRLQLEWRWWVASLTFALNFLSAVHASAKVNALTRGRGGRIKNGLLCRYAFACVIWNASPHWAWMAAVNFRCPSDLPELLHLNILLYISAPANTQNTCISPFSEKPNILSLISTP